MDTNLQTGPAGQQRRATLLGLAAVLCWSTVATAFKLSLEHLSVPQLVLFASIFSWLFLGALLFVRGELAAALSSLRRRWRRALPMGLLNPFLYYLVLLGAYQRLPAQVAQPINFTWAITLSLLSVPLLGHALRRRELVAALVAYGGVVVVATRGDMATLAVADLPGVGLALLSTLLWCTYWIVGVRDTRGEPVQNLFGQFTLAIPVSALFCAATGRLHPLDWRGVAGAAYVGLFEMGVSYVLWLGAMRLTTSTARIANLIFIAPPISLLLIALILREPVRPSTLVGLGLILSGLALQRRAPPRASREFTDDPAARRRREHT